VGRKQNLVVCGFCQNPYRRPKGSAHRCELLRRTPRPRGRVVTDRRDGERGTEPRDSAPTRWQSRVRLLARCATANTPTTRPCDTPVAAIRHFLPKIAREWLNQVTIVDTAASGLNTDAVGRGRRSGQIRKGPPERAICSGRRRRRWSIRLSFLARRPCCNRANDHICIYFTALAAPLSTANVARAGELTSVQLCRWDFLVANGHDLFTCMPILRSAPARPTRSTFLDLSHDNNSGQTYAVNQVTGLS